MMNRNEKSYARNEKLAMLVCSEKMKCIFKLLSEQFLISSCFDITVKYLLLYISYYIVVIPLPMAWECCVF